MAWRGISDATKVKKVNNGAELSRTFGDVDLSIVESGFGILDRHLRFRQLFSEGIESLTLGFTGSLVRNFQQKAP